MKLKLSRAMSKINLEKEMLSAIYSLTDKINSSFDIVYIYIGSGV